MQDPEVMVAFQDVAQNPALSKASDIGLHQLGPVQSICCREPREGRQSDAHKRRKDVNNCWRAEKDGNLKTVKQQAFICSRQPQDAALFKGAPWLLLDKDRKHLDSEMENQRKCWYQYEQQIIEINSPGLGGNMTSRSSCQPESSELFVVGNKSITSTELFPPPSGVKMLNYPTGMVAKEEGNSYLSSNPPPTCHPPFPVP
ncbi:hypothetical protein GH733_007195 [Mirounga leonina]|nr:hypothetical protein GH733_007195 [Mirounga leonina]